MTKYLVAWACSMMVLIQSCAADCGAISAFYIPLKMELFQPPSPEYLSEHGQRIGGVLPSVCKLIEAVRNTAGGIEAPDAHKRLRIRILYSEANGEIFITAEKQVIFRGRVVPIAERIVSDAVDEIVQSARANVDSAK